MPVSSLQQSGGEAAGVSRMCPVSGQDHGQQKSPRQREEGKHTLRSCRKSSSSESIRKRRRRHSDRRSPRVPQKSLVRARGHLFTGKIPIVFEDAFGELGRTSDVISALTAAGLYQDIERSKISRKVRAGRGKMRGRRFKQRKSLLIVTAEKPLKAARNLAGVDAITLSQTEYRTPCTRDAAGSAYGIYRRCNLKTRGTVRWFFDIRM